MGYCRERQNLVSHGEHMGHKWAWMTSLLGPLTFYYQIKGGYGIHMIHFDNFFLKDLVLVYYEFFVTLYMMSLCVFSIVLLFLYGIHYLDHAPMMLLLFDFNINGVDYLSHQLCTYMHHQIIQLNMFHFNVFTCVYMSVL